MNWNILWYAISTLFGVVTGALGTAWTWGRKYQAIIQTQKDQGKSLAALWKAHEAHKAEVDKRLTETGGQMIKDLAEIKVTVAVIQTQTQNHAENCVTQKELSASTKEITERLANIEGYMAARKQGEH